MPNESKAIWEKAFEVLNNRYPFAQDLADVLAVDQSTVFRWREGKVPAAGNRKRIIEKASELPPVFKN